MLEDDHLLERFTINPKVMVGKPCIRGTRLTVEYILKMLASGVSPAEILRQYEGLTDEDIRACILYAKSSPSTNYG